LEVVMQEPQKARRFFPQGVLLAAFGVLALAAAGIVWMTGVLQGADSDSTPHRLILYSESSPSPVLTDEQAVAAGFVVVHSADALMRDVDKSTRAIIIMSDPGRLDVGWIRDQYKAGIIIGALNTSREQLAEIVGDSSSQLTIPPTGLPEPYVVMASQITCPNGHESGRGMTSVPLHDASDSAGALAQLIETELRFYNWVCTATPPASPENGR
jgi:hypothetical protein